MKVMIKVSSIFALLVMVVSCATTPRTLPEKYNLGNDLEEVNQISTLRVSGWENVDNQSLILRASLKAIRSDYYLLVLRRPIDATYSNFSIAIENTAAKNRAYSAQSLVSDIRESSTRGHPGSEFHEAPSNISGIRSGHDRVVLETYGGPPEYYVIDRIYKLTGKEQAEQIKEWLRTH